MKKSFTLLELLIVISLIALLAAAAFALINPQRQIEKSWDTRRKNDLSQLQKVLEDFYNDKNCYPKPAEVCYDPTVNPTCQICGLRSTPLPISPYLSNLPCDPQQSLKPFLYQVDSITCPRWYRVFSKISNTSDPVINQVGCGTGCGPASDPTGYQYYISSPNTGSN